MLSFKQHNMTILMLSEIISTDSKQRKHRNYEHFLTHSKRLKYSQPVFM